MAEIIQAPPIGTNLDDLTRKMQQLCNLVNKMITNIPADSTASDVAGVVSDLNSLQDVFKALNGN